MNSAELSEQAAKVRAQIAKINGELAETEASFADAGVDYLSSKKSASSDRLAQIAARGQALGNLRNQLEDRLSGLESQIVEAQRSENRERNVKAILRADADSLTAYADYCQAQSEFDVLALNLGEKLADAYRRICATQKNYLTAAAELSPTPRDEEPDERDLRLSKLFGELEAAGFDGSVIKFDSWAEEIARFTYSYSGLLSASRPPLPELRFGDVAWQIMRRVARLAAEGRSETGDQQLNPPDDDRQHDAQRSSEVNE